MELAEGHAALYASLDRLPHVQARHVYAHYILGRSKTGIARAENVTENATRDSISRSIGGQIMAQTRPSYHKEVKTASFQGRMITVENLTPILAPKVRDKRKREIETGLYSVFRKYAPGRAEMR